MGLSFTADIGQSSRVTTMLAESSYITPAAFFIDNIYKARLNKTQFIADWDNVKGSWVKCVYIWKEAMYFVGILTGTV